MWGIINFPVYLRLRRLRQAQAAVRWLSLSKPTPPLTRSGGEALVEPAEANT